MLNIEYRPIAALVPYSRNPRTHNDAQIAKIAASIVEYGWTNPILVDGTNGIIAGHGRLAAARKLNLETVPVIELAHLSPEQKRAYVISDNRLALDAGWDEELLALELAELNDAGYDLALTGFEQDELDDLMASLDGESSGQTEDDAVPEVPVVALTQPGDVWLLGRHRLLCGDATRTNDIKRLMRDDLADMVFTDPPYNVNYGETAKDKIRAKAGTKAGRKIMNDNLGEDFEAFLTAACQNMLEQTKGALYVCMSSSELDTLQAAFRNAGGKWSTFIIWAKNTFTLGRADYQRQYEPILYGWRDGADHFWCGARDQGDVWFYNKPHKNELHPTMKPVELVERALLNSSKSRDIVLDPFGGSGTTLIAAEKCGRQARLIELDPKYCDVIIRRWQDWTGLKATRETDGTAFDDLVAEAGETSR